MGDRVAGKVAMVTGGSRGIGAAIASRLAAEGARVVIGDVQEAERVAAAASEIGEPGLFVPLDVRDIDQWRSAVATTEAAFGPIDILVNNAGIIGWGGVAKMTEERFREILDVNAIGTFLGMKTVLESMTRAGGGSIINISSSAGMVGGAATIGYTASKWAIRGMTKAAAIELGPLGIRVNSVHPHILLTPMAEAGRATDLGLPPIGRYGHPEDAGWLVLFLASDESSYISGTEHVLDGGALAGWR